MTYVLIRIFMAVIFVFSVYKWGDWKNWRKYYPTMLFFGMGDLIYHVVFQSKPLWTFQAGFFLQSINELFVIFFIFFTTVLLFLSRFPDGFSRQIIYIIKWIALYVSIEVFTTSIGMQVDYNGWNIWWSVLFNIVMFPLLILHHKNPILAWIVGFVFLVFIMKTFNMPFIVNK